MIGLAVFMAVFALCFAALGFANHRAIWWRFKAPRFADPAANEPSDAGFRVHRALCFAVAIMSAWASISMFRVILPDEADHDEQLERVRSVAEWLDGTSKYALPSGDDESWSDYINPELRGPERDDPIASVAWRSEDLVPDGNIERYEVGGGEDAICLTVTAKPAKDQPVPEGMDPVSFVLTTEVADEECRTY